MSGTSLAVSVIHFHTKIVDIALCHSSFQVTTGGASKEVGLFSLANIWLVIMKIISGSIIFCSVF